jgi:uncharacterized membrane protein YhaH (DUF805 family)
MHTKFFVLGLAIGSFLVAFFSTSAFVTMDLCTSMSDKTITVIGWLICIVLSPLIPICAIGTDEWHDRRVKRN